MRLNHLLGAIVAVAAAAACGDTPETQATELDAEQDLALPPDKADSPYTDCQLRQIAAHANDPDTTTELLLAAGITKKAASGIVAHRAGADAQTGTADDNPFDDAAELDAVPFVGPATFQKLVGLIKPRCEQRMSAEPTFSPTLYADSHLPKIAQLIDGAQRSVDVAIYSYGDKLISEALQRAVSRGVSVRMVYESARDEKSKPEGTTSAKLEDVGVDVRYINKIMHHKFAIIDGPRTSADQAFSAVLVTGSGNWSTSAGTRYDENTTILRNAGELVLRFQREFNTLWDNSRDLVWNQELKFFTSKPISTSFIADEPAVHAVFTSANFEVTQSSAGPGFSLVAGREEIANKLVELIRGAKKSIHVANGHLRSRPVAEALMAKWKENPSLDVRVYLDNQEYISQGFNESQKADLTKCLTTAGDNAVKQQACYDVGYLFSYPVQESGIALRFKFYCYRWDFSYALQMHHKYMVFDGETVASGSYNLSDNAEHATMENTVIYQGAQLPDLVKAFEDNFEGMWATGEADGRYQKLMDLIANTTDPIPIAFDPIALDWGKVTELKTAIRKACPAVDSLEYRKSPASHTKCFR
jgi:phosphatidylserine/phosphatidylglycerophosphate/cardiolipin synthase-like enzyme